MNLFIFILIFHNKFICLISKKNSLYLLIIILLEYAFNYFFNLLIKKLNINLI
jgi:hypothetical protein